MSLTSNFKHLTSNVSAPSTSYFSLASGIHQRAEIRSDQTDEKFKNGGHRVAAIIEEKIMNLFVEMKVAIAVATSLVALIVGAMAQG